MSGDPIRSIINEDATKLGIIHIKPIRLSQYKLADEIFRLHLVMIIPLLQAVYKIFLSVHHLGYLTQDGIFKTKPFWKGVHPLNLNPKKFDDHLAVTLAAILIMYGK